ncbi:MAG: tetratricopeptide repeat protein, partial [Candidatus Kapaibacteriota bacterium]
MKKFKIAKLILLVFILTIGFGLALSQGILEDKYKLAQSLEKSGEFSKAEEIYSEIYLQNKNRYEFFLGLVRCKKALNKFSEILPLLEEQLQLRKTSDLLLIGSEANWYLGNYEEAKLYWNDAIKTYSMNDSTYIKVAQQQSKLKQFKLAIETFLLGRKHLKSESLFFDELINLYLVVGDFEKAIEEILLEYERSNNINWAQAKISLFIENKEARQALEQKLKKPKSGFEILYKYLHAWFLYSTKEFQQSFEIYKEIDKLVDSKGYEIYKFGNTALNDGEYEVALRAFEYLISLGKRTNYLVSGIFGLAKVMDLKLLNQINIENSVVFNVINKYEQALQEISSSNPLYFDIKFRIAQLYYIYLKDYSKAEKILLDLIKTKNNPLLWKTHLLLGDVYLCQYNFSKAEWQYNSVISNNYRSKTNEYFIGLLKLGKAKFYQSNFDSAQYYFFKLIEDSPSEIANEVIE